MNGPLAVSDIYVNGSIYANQLSGVVSLSLCPWCDSLLSTRPTGLLLCLYLLCRLQIKGELMNWTKASALWDFVLLYQLHLLILCTQMSPCTLLQLFVLFTFQTNFSLLYWESVSVTESVAWASVTCICIPHLQLLVGSLFVEWCMSTLAINRQTFCSEITQIFFLFF